MTNPEAIATILCGSFRLVPVPGTELREETQAQSLARVSSDCIYCDEWELIAYNALTKAKALSAALVEERATTDQFRRRLAHAVADRESLRTDLDQAHAHLGALTKAVDELDSLGEWIWSEADDKTLLSIHLSESHHTELMDSMDAARAFLRRS